MSQVFEHQQLLAALTNAEKRFPSPGLHQMSKEVSRIGGLFGEMAYQRKMSLEISDASTCELINGLLNEK